MSFGYEQHRRLQELLSAKNPDQGRYGVQVTTQSQRIPNQRTPAEQIPYVSLRLADPEFFVENPQMVSRYEANNYRTLQIYFCERLAATMSPEELCGYLWGKAMTWKETDRSTKSGTLMEGIYRTRRGSRQVMTQFPKAEEVKAEHSLA